jgi:hypothetical protein
MESGSRRKLRNSCDPIRMTRLTGLKGKKHGNMTNGSQLRSASEWKKATSQASKVSRGTVITEQEP